MALHATAQYHDLNVDAATVEANLFQEVRPLGVPERVWTDVNGLLVDPPQTTQTMTVSSVHGVR
eukprot:9208942-Pyramimonas_sp.AAC.1